MHPPRSPVGDARTARLSIVVPTLNEAASIEGTLAALAPLRQRGAEVIVIDGGSSDATVDLAADGADHVFVAERGRAHQMNAGARRGVGDTLLFLHADTVLPTDADVQIARALQRGRWGRFDVAIVGGSRWLGLIALLMNSRSRLTGICTGDQALFMTRELFDVLGGFADLPLMEDVEFSRRARRIARPVAIAARAQTSGRRWERHGVWRTVLLMWSLRWRYFFGADPDALARRYREVR
jgi:rSAM/selenodomain-associated transferase 2